MKKPEIKWVIFVVTAAGGFLSMLDSNTVNVALYDIAKNFGCSLNLAQWVVAGYILVLSTFLTLFGKLNDIVNRKMLYMCGFCVFAAGSFLNLISPDIKFLICSRLFQALGASILLSNSYAIICTVFKGKKRAKALGFTSAIMALAGVGGPALGGFLMHYLNWRAVFAPGIIIGILGAFFSYKYIPSIVKKKAFKFDYTGMFLLLTATSCLLFAIAQGHIWGWFSTESISLITLSILFGILFLLTENNIKSPLIDLKLFGSKPFLLGNLGLLFSYFALFANALLFPFYAQEILHASALKTGLLIMPFSFCFMLSASFSGNILNKHGSKFMTVFGGILIIIGLLIFSGCGVEDNYTKIIIAQMFMGSGSGMYQPGANIGIINSAPHDQMGVASGILALFRNSGMLLGIMISISVFEYIKDLKTSSGFTDSDAFIYAYHAALLLGAFFALVCLILSFCAYKKTKKSSNVVYKNAA